MRLALALIAGLTVAAAAAPDTGPIVIRHQDVPLVTVYAWERSGNFINALAGSKTEIPYDAARLQVKVYTFPSGEIRAIRFGNGVRTHRHINQTDTILYSWQTHRVHFVNDMAVVTEPGDFALHEKGVYHSGEEIRRGGGIDLEFAFAAPAGHNDPTGYWSLAASHPLEPAAAWVTPAGPVEAIGAAAVAAAPVNAARYMVRAALFPGYEAREVKVAAGAVIRSRDSRCDRLMFILSGTFRVSVGGRDYSVGPEDAARAPAAQDFELVALTDGSYAEAKQQK